MIQSKNEHLAISTKLSKILKDEGIRNLTEIQKKALPYIRTNHNLVIVSPSSTGKTLIAEMIAISDFLEENGEEIDKFIAKDRTRLALKYKENTTDFQAKSIILVPLRALAEEKANKIARTYQSLNLKVHISISDVEFDEEEINKSHILISTYERFRSILGRMPNLLTKVRNVIVDEFHLIGDKSRGTNLETIILTLKNKVRLILLSATVENPEDIANWLDAQLLISKKRAIPLKYSIIPTFKPENYVKKIIQKNIVSDAQTLIFCGTRINTEENALFYSKYISKFLNEHKTTSREEIEDFIQTLPITNENKNNSKILELIQCGTAFHHAGLSRDVKKTIEEMFRLKLIRVLFCTETLSAGVNLPARDVIILSARRWNEEFLSRNVFHQIAGRAGRLNYDQAGKCSIFVQDRLEERKIRSLYWKFDNESKDLDKYELYFETITNPIKTKSDLEKVILTLIYNNKINREQLFELLGESYSGFWEKKYLAENYLGLGNEKNNLICLLTFNTQMQYAQLKENLIKKISKLKIVEKFYDDNKSSFLIRDYEREFYVSIEDEIINCSCKNENLICNHILFILFTLPDYSATKILNNNFAIFDNLVLQGYLKETNTGFIQPTTKGSICAEMGVSLQRFDYLRNWLLYNLNSKRTSISEILAGILRLSPEVENGDFSFSNDVYYKPLFEHIILGIEFNDVIKRHQLYEGDILRIESTISSLITGLLPLADYLGLDILSKNLTKLEKMVNSAIFHAY